MPACVCEEDSLREGASLARRLTAEAFGTAMLLATVVGSGIMGERLSGGNVAVALLANTLATGAILVALILTFGPISGAHFNPAVTLADASQGGLPWRTCPASWRRNSRGRRQRRRSSAGWCRRCPPRQRTLHMTLAAYAATGFLVAGIHAYLLLRDRSR